MWPLNKIFVVMDDETKEKIVYNILKKYAKNNGLVEYRYPDGFYCFGNADSQEMADKKHEEWLEKQKTLNVYDDETNNR